MRSPKQVGKSKKKLKTRAKARAAAIRKRTSPRRTKQQHGVSASGLIADVLMGALALLIGRVVQDFEFRPPQDVAVPKSRRIGKEKPSDVVIDVKPERVQ
jgi:hypothetical protein